jgi:two-component system chemotaxis response regulator CheY
MSAGRMSGQKQVLVVDDAALVRRFYRATLEQAGFAVREALNGVEALEKLLEEPADLVIADVNMPLMDGMTLLRRLRCMTHPYCTVPVLVTSTEAAARDKAEAVAAGANFYLVKPVAPELLARVAALLSGTAREQAADG